MSSTHAPSTVLAAAAELENAVALIACGTRLGKTRPCERHVNKGPGLVRIASTGAMDALAAAICGSERCRSCDACVTKARQIIDVYAEALCRTP
ncbi:hypothetical protein ACGFR8_31505 [Streptomyces brevispora]|uniref:hypothetical protein n=1 Tax=Streptomyces brevispora TaxID=887462 RepID=UPI003713884D